MLVEEIKSLARTAFLNAHGINTPTMADFKLLLLVGEMCTAGSCQLLWTGSSTLWFYVSWFHLSFCPLLCHSHWISLTLGRDMLSHTADHLQMLHLCPSYSLVQWCPVPQVLTLYMPNSYAFSHLHVSGLSAPKYLFHQEIFPAPPRLSEVTLLSRHLFCIVELLLCLF